MESAIVEGLLEWVYLVYLGFVLPFFLLPR